MDPGVRYHGMKANPIGYLCSKYECFLTTGCQDNRLLENLTKRDGNVYDRGNYNSSSALCAVELKSGFSNDMAHILNLKCLYPKHNDNFVGKM